MPVVQLDFPKRERTSTARKELDELWRKIAQALSRSPLNLHLSLVNKSEEVQNEYPGEVQSEYPSTAVPGAVHKLTVNDRLLRTSFFRHATYAYEGLEKLDLSRWAATLKIPKDDLVFQIPLAVFLKTWRTQMTSPANPTSAPAGGNVRYSKILFINERKAHDFYSLIYDALSERGDFSIGDGIFYNPTLAAFHPHITLTLQQEISYHVRNLSHDKQRSGVRLLAQLLLPVKTLQIFGIEAFDPLLLPYHPVGYFVKSTQFRKPLELMLDANFGDFLALLQDNPTETSLSL